MIDQKKMISIYPYDTKAAQITINMVILRNTEEYNGIYLELLLSTHIM